MFTRKSGYEASPWTEVSHGQIHQAFSVPGWSSPPKAVPELQIVWNPNPATWRLGYPYEISRVSTKMGTTLSTTPPREGVGYIYIIVYLIIYICIIYTCVGVCVCMYVCMCIYIYISCWLSWRHEGCPCRWWEYMGIQPFGVGPIASNWTDVAWFCQIKVAILDAYLLRTGL